jgi:hypothetical protein
VRADPEPEIIFVDLDSEGTVVEAYPNGPVLSNLLELQRRMARVALEKFVICVG